MGFLSIQSSVRRTSSPQLMRPKSLASVSILSLGLIVTSQPQARAGTYDGATYVSYIYDSSATGDDPIINIEPPGTGSLATSSGAADAGAIIVNEAEENVSQDGPGRVTITGAFSTRKIVNWFWKPSNPTTDPAPNVTPSYAHTYNARGSSHQSNGGYGASDFYMVTNRYYNSYQYQDIAGDACEGDNGSYHKVGSITYNGPTENNAFTTDLTSYMHIAVTATVEPRYPSGTASADFGTNSSISVVLTSP
jgi:hypothetical protein